MFKFVMNVVTHQAVTDIFVCQVCICLAPFNLVASLNASSTYVC